MQTSLSSPTPLTFSRPPEFSFQWSQQLSRTSSRGKAASHSNDSLLHNSMRLIPPAASPLQMIMGETSTTAPVRKDESAVVWKIHVIAKLTVCLSSNTYRNSLYLFFILFQKKESKKLQCLWVTRKHNWKTGLVWTKVENFAVKVSPQTMLRAATVALVPEVDSAVYCSN